MVWLNNQDKTETIVESIKPNSKNSGWILQGQDFDCFAWNSDKLLSHLVTAIEAWIESGNEGKQLKIIADTKEKRGFTVVLNEIKGKAVPCRWYRLPSGYTTANPDFLDEPNPFL